jgi:hypothetical protein
MARDIDQLLRADTANVEQTKRLFDAFDPALFEAFNRATRMFDWFAALIGHHLSDLDDMHEIKRCGKTLGARSLAELRAILARETHDEARRELVGRIERANDRILGRRLRGLVLTMIDRAYHWGVTDLLRMRLTPAIGYQRIESEAFALICRMRDHPHIARKWMEIASDDDGVNFYRENQGALRDEMKRTKLDFAYDSASGIALHVRFAGAAYGFQQKAHEVGEAFVHEMKLLCQELDPKEPKYFLAQALGFLRTQDRIFAALPSAFPEVRDDTWGESVAAFTRIVDALGQRFVQKFPAHVDRWARLFQYPIRGPE